MRTYRSKGFTMLEMVICMIILGALAGLAMTRFYSTIEYSRSSEALAAFSQIRNSMERFLLRVAPGQLVQFLGGGSKNRDFLLEQCQFLREALQMLLVPSDRRVIQWPGVENIHCSKLQAMTALKHFLTQLTRYR